MQIRAATNADCAAVQALIFQVLEEYGLRPDATGMDKDLSTLEQSYHQQQGYFGVVEDASGRIVATLGLQKVDAQSCELRKMYALPQARGQGLGHALMRFALFHAQRLGYTRVILETVTPLVEARALYARYGFSSYAPDEISWRCDQAMQRELGSIPADWERWRLGRE
nr:GNAT family N-acetyltransferase [Oceanococcus sp. HetDA_MAG_MS8]